MAKRKLLGLKAPFLTKVSLPAATSIDRTRYPFTLPFLSDEFELSINKPITIIVGENGSGKSTLLEAMAANCGFNLTGGGKSHLYDSRTDVLPLAKALRFSWSVRMTSGFFMRAESFYNFASYIDDLAKEAGPKAYHPYGKKSLHQQSHGEAFLSLFANRLGGRGIYILDEPEAALSPQRQLALIKILIELTETGTHQIIMATHSPILMAIPKATLLVIQDGRMTEQPYTSTEHFKLTKGFLDSPERYLRHLLGEGKG